jgi:hypothetical protein
MADSEATRPVDSDLKFERGAIWQLEETAADSIR